jgi:hypothetical protein
MDASNVLAPEVKVGAESDRIVIDVWLNCSLHATPTR